MVPTVDRGLRLAPLWAIETAGESPSMKSTSGLSICPRNCLAYADSDSTYRRCPSAKIVSKARLDLPDPDNPVKTIRALRGRSSESSFRLCSRAPRKTRRSATLNSVLQIGTWRLQGIGLKGWPDRRLSAMAPTPRRLSHALDPGYQQQKRSVRDSGWVLSTLPTRVSLRGDLR